MAVESYAHSGPSAIGIPGLGFSVDRQTGWIGRELLEVPSRIHGLWTIGHSSGIHMKTTPVPTELGQVYWTIGVD
jgi:hypothetical protein